MNKNIITIFLILAFFGMQMPLVKAEAQCPNFSNISLSADTVVSKIDECLAARSSWNTASITDFHCPSGEMSHEDSQALTPDRLAYHITVNLFFNESDKMMTEYMWQLNTIRNKNPIEWMYEYNSCIYGKGKQVEKSLSYFYDHICQFSFVSDFLNSHSDKETRKFLQNTEWYPQTVCSQLASQKKEAWQHFGHLITVKSIYKGYQNDRDTFMSGVQWQYRSIIEKFHNYQKIIFRAASKITNYIREAVK